MGAIGSAGRCTGCLSVRVTVDGASGAVTAVDALADSLVPDPEDFQGPIGETENGETVGGPQPLGACLCVAARVFPIVGPYLVAVLPYRNFLPLGRIVVSPMETSSIAHCQIFEDSRADVLLALSDALTTAKFPASASGENTEITIPFLFE